MKLEPFKMERWQSIWENEVQYNLSESGVHPLSLSELISSKDLEEILEIKLGYIQTNGPSELREKIGLLYPGTDIANILVTSGSAEANFLLVWSHIDPGDEIVFMLPNYMQIWGLLRGFGAQVKPLHLKEELGWNLDVDELKRTVSKKTKMIIINNPNNPTGAVLNAKTREAIVGLAEWADAWIVSDEVYQGAELSGSITPSFWGLTKKVVVTNSLSKAYGLPGLRMGWMIGPQDFIQKAWAYHDYTTISLSAVSNRLAQIALSPETRKRILQRTRKILKTNLALLESWLKKQQGLFHLIPPRAGAIAYARYQLEIPSSVLAERFIKEKSVLVVPGEHFEMKNYIRFGYGIQKKNLQTALSRMEEVLKNIRTETV